MFGTWVRDEEEWMDWQGYVMTETLGSLVESDDGGPVMVRRMGLQRMSFRLANLPGSWHLRAEWGSRLLDYYIQLPRLECSRLRSA